MLSANYYVLIYKINIKNITACLWSFQQKFNVGLSSISQIDTRYQNGMRIIDKSTQSINVIIF